MIEFKFKTSKRDDGPMNFVDLPGFNEERLANRSAFLAREFEIKNGKTVIPQLQHGSVIEIVDNSNIFQTLPPGRLISDIPCDGLITDKKGLALTVGAGDCYPVFLYDYVQEVICLLHCGWRGLADKIVAKAVYKLMSEFNCERRNIHIEVGPGSCKECYEVGPEVFKPFGLAFKEKGKFDLLNEIAGQASLYYKNSHFSPDDHPCTYHQEEYFSARRDGKINGVLQTQMAVAIMQ